MANIRSRRAAAVQQADQAKVQAAVAAGRVTRVSDKVSSLQEGEWVPANFSPEIMALYEEMGAARAAFYDAAYASLNAKIVAGKLTVPAGTVPKIGNRFGKLTVSAVKPTTRTSRADPDAIDLT